MGMREFCAACEVTTRLTARLPRRLRNIGRFTTLATNLPPGRHSVRCEVLEETADLGGGHEFRIISLMSL